jgi:UTP--glucose-1-phosphate uridylyltransferase
MFLPIMELSLDPATRALLDSYGFDAGTFAQLRARMLAGELSTDANRLRAPVELPNANDVRVLPDPNTEARRALHERGAAAIRAGQVGCVVLAGGMATRFGGVVKAAATALPGRSFLALKLADIRRTARELGARVPVYLMSSFATHEVIERMVQAEQSDEAPIEVFPQLISLRLDPSGNLFLENGAKPSPYAPGHGDLTFALRKSGALSRFLARGGRMLTVSNVDNLGATLDPAILGAHLASEAQMTVEVAARAPGEPGGAPARVGGVLQIIEDFRFPHGFDVQSIPYFNTNTFVLNAAALDRDFALTWFLVRKKVEGREAIQFEHLVGELSALLSCSCLLVPRDGDYGRFQPVKDPEELAKRAPQIERILRNRGAL